jgi:hypothetical protein
MEVVKRGNEFSFLERLIVRMNTQRETLERVFQLNDGNVDGLILEVGLGSGRVYDHLRCQYPKNRIVAFDFKVDTRPEYSPKPEDTILGDIKETLPNFAAQNPNAVGLIHLDIGDHDHTKATLYYNSLAFHINFMTKKTACILADRKIELDGWENIDLSNLTRQWSYYAIRKIN